MEEANFYQKTIPESLKALKTSEKGLTKEEAKKRLEEYGKNSIHKKRKLRALKVLISQFNSFLIYILIAASIVSFLVGHVIDGVVIAFIVLLNGVIGFIQQYKAEKAIENLKKLIVSKSTVLRNGRQMEILSEELVPGDIVILSEGDKIPADMRLIEIENTQVSEASLTGESLPISKEVGKIKKEVPLAEQVNCLFTGTELVRGTAKALVYKTGMNTVFGKIAGNLQEIEHVKIPVEKRLDKFSKQIGLVVLGLAILIIFIGWLRNFDLTEMFLTSVALAVSAIPEGFPAVLAVGFAISSMMMARKKVVVRKLQAVETLGSVTVICTDKTGTLTEEKMTVKEIFSNNKFYEKEGKEIRVNGKKISVSEHRGLKKLIETSILCNNARFEEIESEVIYLGDPTETALVELAFDLDVNKKELIEKFPSLEKLEFDSKRKMMSVSRFHKNKRIMHSKGAPTKILKLSTHELVNGEVRRLTEKRRLKLLESLNKMESQALRVLGFAYKKLDLGEKLKEENLIFLGFAGMIDPPRKEVRGAIKNCKAAGIEVKIITGDSPITAKAIGEQIGIEGRVVTELELEEMSDLELIKQIKKIAIFARMTPEQKLRVTKILQTQGEVVAVTGDGINDALALKSADIGIAMGKRGTDVSRDVADIVLIDDNFASLVEGIKEGRKTYDNIKKFTKYLLAINFSEIFLIIFAIIAGLDLPLLALQILLINLVIESFPSLSLIFEKGENVMRSKPRTEKSLFSGIWSYLIMAGILVFVVELIVYLIGLNRGFPIELVRTLVLTTAIVYELLFIYTVRSNKPLHKIGFFSNKWLNIAVLSSLGVYLALMYSPLGVAFSLIPLTIQNWLLILPFAISGVVIFELYKIIKEKRRKNNYFFK